jgi:hypothetical protein
MMLNKEIIATHTQIYENTHSRKTKQNTNWKFNLDFLLKKTYS